MITEAVPRVPQDVPGLRRGIAAFMADRYSGPLYYLQMIAVGRQPICPQFRDEARSAHVLAETEARRLSAADLWFVDEDLCDLVEASFPTMPPFPTRAQDLPSTSGFVVFAKPVALLTRDAVGVDADLIEGFLPGSQTDPRFRANTEQLVDGGVRIVAVSWSPMDTPGFPGLVGGWPAGGVWMTFYAESNIGHLDLEPAEAAAARAMLPPLSPDNEVILAWCPDGLTVEDQARYLLPMEEGFTSRWAALLFAAFQLAGQANLGETAAVPVPRAERRRTERDGLPVPKEIRVVRLRRHVREARAADAATAGGDRTYRHRWIVRGHWRNVWYSTIGQHRPRWIAPYLAVPAGAEDAPLLGGDKVTRVGAPRKADT